MNQIIKTIIGSVAVILFFRVPAQNLSPVPMYDCENITPTFAFLLNGVHSNRCFEDAGNNQQPIIIDASQNITLKAGEYFHFDNEVQIDPGPNGNFHGLIEKSGVTLAWFEPINTAWTSVEKYEKLEIGVNLSSPVNTLISDFISSDKSVLDPSKPGLNPFDPEDIDVKAVFSFYNTTLGTWSDNFSSATNALYEQILGFPFPIEVYGFYYKELERNTTAPLTEREWDDVNMVDAYNSDYNFRIRFAPPLEGLWRCNITATIDGTTFAANQFTFQCTPNPDNLGYVKVGSNKRFLTLGGSTFFPAGRNIPHPQCYDPNNNYGCSSIATLANWDNGNNNPAYDLSFIDEITDYYNNGGDYFRMLFFGEHYEIEFEKLNNYYDRMFEAWEFDRVVDHCKSLGMRIHLCLQNHEPFQRRGDYTLMFDWLDKQETDDWDGCGQWKTDDVGYCYNSELGLDNPTDFLMDVQAIKYYKHRLRYITSRWGYSTTISMMELRSEMNNHAKENSCVPDTDWKPYHIQANDDFPNKISYWNDVMTTYLKTHQYFPHLTVVNYTGSPTSVQINGTDNYVSKILHGDHSYYKSNVDIASYNYYPGGPSKFEGVYKVFRDLNMEITPTNIHLIINKPLINSETGNPHFNKCSQDVEYIKDVWSSSFTGAAMTAMDWQYQHRPELAVHLKNVREFMQGINFDGGSDGPWLPQYHERNDDKAASSYTLVSQEDKVRAVGVVVNNTVNFYTMSTIPGSDCDSVELISLDLAIRDLYSTNTVVDADINAQLFNGDNEIKLENFGFVNKYIIDWYKPAGQLVNVSIKWSDAFGNLRLDFPTLSNSVNTVTVANSVPFMVAYKIRRYNEPSFILPNDGVLLESNEAKLADLLLQQGSLEEKTSVIDDNRVIETKKEEESALIQLNPNPTNGNCTITFTGDTKQTTLKILSSIGKVVQSMQLKNNIQVLNLEKQPAGIYLVIIETPDAIYTKKLIIE